MIWLGNLASRETAGKKLVCFTEKEEYDLPSFFDPIYKSRLIGLWGSRHKFCRVSRTFSCGPGFHEAGGCVGRFSLNPYSLGR